jgi:multiple sugar transport system permease protein
MPRRVAKTVIGVLILAWSLGPMYWALAVSLSRPANLTGNLSFFPDPFTLTSYRALFSSGSLNFLAALRNSAIEGLATMALTVFVALLAAFAFVRIRFFGSKLIFLVVLGTLALPGYAVIIPLFQMASQLHQVDTYQSIVLVNVSASLPLAVWILRSHIAAMPAEIEQAARIDGAPTRVILAKIVAPLIAPGVAAASVVVLLTAWSSFLVPLVLSSTYRTLPVTVVIPQYVTKFGEEFGLQAAAGILALLPPVAVVLWLNRYLVLGLTFRGVNG